MIYLSRCGMLIARPPEIPQKELQVAKRHIWCFPASCALPPLETALLETPDRGPARKYSPGICTGIKKKVRFGNPDLSQVSTSYVEKHNQTMRQHMKRFARLTAAHSKKIENHCHMVALYTVWYNYARINSAVKMSPAMAAGLSDRLWDVADIVQLVECLEMKEAA